MINSNSPGLDPVTKAQLEHLENEKRFKALEDNNESTLRFATLTNNSLVMLKSKVEKK